MKTQILTKSLAVLTVAGLVFTGSNALAQDASAVVTVQPAAPAPAPQLSYGVSQIVQLTQAKVGQDTIVAYVRNSGNSYGLDANQIIYLRQQGVSDSVITAMLTQPKPPVAVASTSLPMPSTPAPQVAGPAYGASSTAMSTATVEPSATYVQTVPTYYYDQPYDYYPYYYGWYPGVSIGFGWGWNGYGGWRGYGGWHGGGGYGGGWRGGGGGWHGGGGGGGGWHGGGGGGHR